MKPALDVITIGRASVDLYGQQVGGRLEDMASFSKAVGGYDFNEAAKANPDTPNFHSNDGKLTFAIITHTAGNGFFDPTYVGAKAAADLLGVNLIMLGSEAPVDDIPRELEILNQIIQDPTIDGLIMTTPQSAPMTTSSRRPRSSAFPSPPPTASIR